MWILESHHAYFFLTPNPLIKLLGNVLLKECKKTFQSLAARRVQNSSSPLLKPVLSASILCRKTHHQRSWTLALREHIDHGNSSVKAKTNKRCTSNPKTSTWWNSIFRLLVSCILIGPAQRYVHVDTLLTHYSFKVAGLLNIFSRSWNYPLLFFGTHSFSSLSQTILNCDTLYKHELDAKLPGTKSFVCFTLSFQSTDTQKSNRSQNLILHRLKEMHCDSFYWHHWL